MSKMKIAVDGKPIFVWDGDDDAIAKILENYPRGARGVGVTPEALADSTIVHLRKGTSLLKSADDPGGQEMLMMGVVWRILTSETGNAERPGKISTYAANTDFNVNIEVGAESYTMQIDAISKFDS